MYSLFFWPTFGKRLVKDFRDTVSEIEVEDFQIASELFIHINQGTQRLQSFSLEYPRYEEAFVKIGSE